MENYEGFYKGGYSSLNSSYGNYIGYRLESGKISAPTSIQTANQLNEVITRIREGVRNVEIQAIQPEVFEQIPKQHFKEINALARLTGVKTSVHAPMIDPAGFGERGYEGEPARISAERRLMSVVEKSHELDPEGNIPIVIHSTAGIPGTEYSADITKKPGEEGRFREEKLIAINRDTGEMVPLKREKRYPYHKIGEGITDYERIPSEEITTINVSDWDDKLTNLEVYKKHASEVMGDAALVLKDDLHKPLTNETMKSFSPDEQIRVQKLGDAEIFLNNVQLSFNTMFEKAYKFGTDEQKKELTKLAKDLVQKEKETYILDPKTREVINRKIGTPLLKMRLLDESIKELANITAHKAPQLYEPVEKFAIDKAALTFGNVAFDSFSKFRQNAPIIAIENLYQGMAFSRPEQMQELVEKAKDVFVRNAVAKGYSENEAKKQANKLIGVTWDVGHLNMMRKAGFTEEDIVGETKKIAKLVKHVHLTDNFGYSDSHLPPGMGNVPTKRILEELEKAGALKNAKAVIEAGGFVQHFKTSPHPMVLSAFGSSIYQAGTAPYWNQTFQMMGNYFGSPMAQMPERYFSAYGSSFSTLPMELGGQIPGSQSRFSGTANA